MDVDAADWHGYEGVTVIDKKTNSTKHGARCIDCGHVLYILSKKNLNTHRSV